MKTKGGARFRQRLGLLKFFHFWNNIYWSQMYIYKTISIVHAALEERKQQRKQRERRENEDEVRSPVLAKYIV